MNHSALQLILQAGYVVKGVLLVLLVFFCCFVGDHIF